MASARSSPKAQKSQTPAAPSLLAYLRQRDSWRQRRLAVAIDALDVKLSRRNEADKEAEIATVVEFLKQAKEKLKKGEKHLNAGWHLFFEAHRMHLHLLDDAELKAEAKSLAAEVEKKLSSSWRGVAALSLLTQDTNDADLLRANIIKAMEIRDEHSSNLYRRLDLLLKQMKIIAGFLLGILAAIAVAASRLFGGRLLLDQSVETGSLRVLLLIMLFGMLGGSLSTALTLARAPSRSPIPEQFLEGWITAMRPLLGGVAAVVVYFAFISLDTKLFEFKGERGAFLIALAIAAGFSERLVLSAMEKIAASG
ncbi:MAG TPA: hypothetical protein VKA60_04430 [Blastocatellia bacterium]|nr:hypothetical protein [Blastocatellia bacterium]